MSVAVGDVALRYLFVALVDLVYDPPVPTAAVSSQSRHLLVVCCLPSMRQVLPHLEVLDLDPQLR